MLFIYETFPTSTSIGTALKIQLMNKTLSISILILCNVFSFLYEAQEPPELVCGLERFAVNQKWCGSFRRSRESVNLRPLSFSSPTHQITACHVRVGVTLSGTSYSYSKPKSQYSWGQRGTETLLLMINSLCFLTTAFKLQKKVMCVH